MKKIHSFATVLTITILLPVGTSCSYTENEEIIINEADSHTVNIQARSSEEGVSIDWPLKLYAFDSVGNLTSSTIVEETNTSSELKLNRGSYTLVALAGTSGLALPDNPKLTDDIGISKSCILTSAPQMAINGINVESDDINTEMTLSYPVAQVIVKLTQMPIDVSNSTATLSPLYTSIAFNGTTSGNGSAEITLNKQNDGSWISSPTYVAPSSENLSLTITADNESYTITTTSKIEAGNIYEINGTYKGEVTVTVSFDIKNWDTGNDINFDITGKEETNAVETNNQ